MFSTLDKALLSAAGIAVLTSSGMAAAYGYRMINLDPPEERGDVPVIASLTEYDGSVKSRSRSTLAWADARQQQALRDGDRIRTLDSSHAEIHYGSGVIVYLDPNTQITVYGPSLTGSDRLIAVDVVDGAIRARVETGTSLTLRDARGTTQATIAASDSGAAEIVAKAPDEVNGSIVMDVTEGTDVEVETSNGNTVVVDAAGPEISLAPTPKPSPTPTPTAAPTPVPPLLKGAPLPFITFDINDVRIRQKAPADVTGVSARGRPGVLHPNGDFEVEVFGLSRGQHQIDIVFQRKDGSYVRQIQRLEVR